MHLIYCIVVTYNGRKWVDKCFGSLRNSDLPIKTIVVDNGSTDGTQEAIQIGFPEVELIQSNENLGFGKANNLGIKKAIEQGADYIFLLNQDAYLFKGSVSRLIENFERIPSAGIVSPIHLAGDEKNFDYRFYQYVNPKDTPSFLGDVLKGETRSLYKTRFVNAAAWFMKTSTIKKVGLFHPMFDHYGEDAEYLHRLKCNNLEIFVSADCTIVHDRPQSVSLFLKDKKYAIRQKQDVLYKYSIGKINKKQVDITCARIILFNLLQFEFNYSRLFLKEWIDIKRKVSRNYEYLL